VGLLAPNFSVVRGTRFLKLNFAADFLATYGNGMVELVACGAMVGSGSPARSARANWYVCFWAWSRREGKARPSGRAKYSRAP
jgi:hypothetical protein